MTKSLYKHTKKELVEVVQDYQDMTSEVEEIINTLLGFDHPLHTLTGLLDIRAAMDRHIFKLSSDQPGCVKIEETSIECNQGEREGHQCA